LLREWETMREVARLLVTKVFLVVIYSVQSISDLSSR